MIEALKRTKKRLENLRDYPPYPLNDFDGRAMTLFCHNDIVELVDFAESAEKKIKVLELAIAKLRFVYGSAIDDYLQEAEKELEAPVEPPVKRCVHAARLNSYYGSHLAGPWCNHAARYCGEETADRCPEYRELEAEKV